MLKNFLGIVIFINLISLAYAEVFVEPIIGYGIGTKIKLENYIYDNGTIVDNGNYTNGTGLGYGLRAGYSKLGFFLGGNYLHRNFSFNDEAFSTSTTSSIDEIGIVAGYNLPILFKLFAGYNLMGSGTLIHRSGKLEMSKGTGSFLGMGYTGLPFIHINFEYHKGAFGEHTNAGILNGKSTNYSYYFLSLSAPIIF